MPRRIAIIPARGGSKRIPRKNVRPFCGKPMIGHILDTARASAAFDVIHVSTEDAEIRATVESLGFTVDFPRPAELADDFTPLMPVLRHALAEFESRGGQFDEVWLLMACAPLVRAEDLIGAAKLMATAEPDQSVIAVARYPVPVEWAFRRLQDGRLRPVQPGMFAVRSQDLQQAYYDTGTFVVYPAAAVRDAEGAGSDERFIGYELDRRQAVDIDDEQDWMLAETLFRATQREASAV